MIKTIQMDTSFIPLTQNKVAIVDKEDYDNLAQYNWHVGKRRTKYKETYDAIRRKYIGIVNGKEIKRVVFMHRIIMDASKGLQVDPINGDTLDNRKSNLRLVTPRKNSQNRHDVRSSKYPGVSWDKSRNKWKSYIQIDGKYNHLGRFESEEEAYMSYKKAVKEFGVV